MVVEWNFMGQTIGKWWFHGISWDFYGDVMGFLWEFNADLMGMYTLVLTHMTDWKDPPCDVYGKTHYISTGPFSIANCWSLPEGTSFLFRKIWEHLDCLPVISRKELLFLGGKIGKKWRRHWGKWGKWFPRIFAWDVLKCLVDFLFFSKSYINQMVGLQFRLPPLSTVNFPFWVRDFLINPHFLGG